MKNCSLLFTLLFAYPVISGLSPLAGNNSRSLIEIGIFSTSVVVDYYGQPDSLFVADRPKIAKLLKADPLTPSIVKVTI